MKRSKKFTYDDGDTRVEVTMRVDTRRMLTREEAARLVAELGDGIMRSMNSARFVNAPLSDIRVR